MSVLLALVATPLATPSATPIVVHDTIQVIKTVPAVSPQLMSAAQLGLLFLSGVGASIFHQITEAIATRKRAEGWSRPLNIFLVFLYGTIIAGLASFISGELTLTYASAIAFATNLLVTLGSATGRYQFFQFVKSLGTGSFTPKPLSPVAQDEDVIPVQSTI